MIKNGAVDRARPLLRLILTAKALIGTRILAFSRRGRRNWIVKTATLLSLVCALWVLPGLAQAQKY
ncbi:MAG TPA: hypothetical protein VJQ55_06840, partial [Candidatus Binatia bacterium]|nr:hypothetical protein [Candidatus Binatia bacterium]